MGGSSYFSSDGLHVRLLLQKFSSINCLRSFLSRSVAFISSFPITVEACEDAKIKKNLKKNGISSVINQAFHK